MDAYAGFGRLIGGPDRERTAVTGQTGGLAWPSAAPPEAVDGLRWQLHDIAQLPRVRAEVRRRLATPHDPHDTDLRDRMVLALDEMASNALRHGGGGTVHASVRLTPSAYLIEVFDRAVECPPVPAVGRDPSEGGLGLYLVAELATQHGWYASGRSKCVWALLPRA
jgi:anti-sigma regulatory factor (Ser/Thr protein kinase)